MGFPLVKSLVLAAALGAAVTATALAAPDTSLGDFDSFVTSSMDKWQVQGAAVAIIHNGETVLLKGYGYGDLEKKEPITEQTLFAIGSTTKAFTATAASILAEEGKLNLNKPIAEFYPEFKMKDEYTSTRATLRDFLAHRSGLPRHDLVWYGAPISRDEVVATIPYLEPTAGLREAWQYNNIGYTLAGVLAGKAAGATWEGLVASRILAPLGMTSTSFSITQMETQPDRSEGFNLDSAKKVVRVPYRNVDNISPAGGINSNITDMAKWASLNLNNGKIGSQQVISQTALMPLKMVQTPLPSGTSGDIVSVGYGMGWFIQYYKGHYNYQHGGNIDGFSSYVSIYPNDNLAIVVLSNMNNSPLPNIIEHAAADRLLNLTRTDWNELMEKAFAQGAGAMQQPTIPPAVSGTAPSHPLKAYAGTYTHPAYGTIKIEYADGTLKGQFHGLEFALKHLHYDVFNADMETAATGRYSVPLQFGYDLTGRINKVEGILEPTCPAIAFSKAPDDSVNLIEHVVLLGDYSVMGIPINISESGEKQLVMTIIGQPPYTLEMEKTNKYIAKGIPGFSVEFEWDGSQDTQPVIIFNQPNGSFTGAKIK